MSHCVFKFQNKKILIENNQNELVELRKVLKDREGFNILESAVTEMTNLLSKQEKRKIEHITETIVKGNIW